MRLTRESLLKVARDTAAQRARISRRIICIYLTGSLLSGDPLLGGTADVDLIFVHDSEPAQPREIVRVSEEVHLDIGHYDQSIFHHPRHLRTDPWLGPFIYSKPLVLHDTQHWFDFMQAATGAQFYQPDYTLQRARALAQTARDAWVDIGNPASVDNHPARVRALFHILEDAGNAIASLSGEPLTDRRFFIHFPQRAQVIQHPEVSARMVQMVTGPEAQLDSVWDIWVHAWKEALSMAGQQKNPLPRAHPASRAYYERAAAALWQDHPIAALWILLRSWTDAVAQFAPNSNELQAWNSACQSLHLDPAHFETRASEIDQLLDMVEEILDRWGKANGVLP